MTDPYQRLGARGIQEIKDHPFFKGTDWKALMEGIEQKQITAYQAIAGCDGVFIPVGKDVDATYFPKANDRDADIRHIIEDQMRCSSIKVDKDFQDFDGTCFETLVSINNAAALAAIRR